MSLPLLLERSSPGMGPKVPLRVPFSRVVVEGLGPDCKVALYSDGEKVLEVDADTDCQLSKVLSRGSIMQAEIIGVGSKVNVRLELK